MTTDAGGTIAVRAPDPARADAPGDLHVLDRIVGAVTQVDEMIAGLQAMRATLLADAVEWMHLATGAGLDGEMPLPTGWNAATVARRTVSSEIAAATRTPEPTVQRQLDEAITLVRDLPRTFDALRRGHIGYRHAQKVIEHACDLESPVRRELDAVLTPGIETLTAAQVSRRARRARERLHPETMTERHTNAVEKRRVVVDPERDGMVWLGAYLPAAEGMAIDNRLTALARSLNTADEQRTLAQLRADAFTDLLIRGDIGAESTGIRAKVFVTVPVMTLLGVAEFAGSLDGYGPIAPDAARRLAADAPSFTRLLTHPETGAVLSYGRTTYAVPADLKQWVNLRDGTCRHPGCDSPAVQCDTDHSHDYALGGGTDHDNLGPLCRRHHNLKHHTRWRLRQVAAGRFEWTSPTGRVYRVHALAADDAMRWTLPG